MEPSNYISSFFKQNDMGFNRQKEYKLNNLLNLKKKLNNLNRETVCNYKDKNKQCTVICNTATYETLNNLMEELMKHKNVNIIRKIDVIEAAKNNVEEQLYLEVRGGLPLIKYLLLSTTQHQRCWSKHMGLEC